MIHQLQLPLLPSFVVLCMISQILDRVKAAYGLFRKGHNKNWPPEILEHNKCLNMHEAQTKKQGISTNTHQY